MVSLVQLVRTLLCGGRCHRFESDMKPKFFTSSKKHLSLDKDGGIIAMPNSLKGNVGDIDKLKNQSLRLQTLRRTFAKVLQYRLAV